MKMAKNVEQQFALKIEINQGYVQRNYVHPNDSPPYNGERVPIRFTY